MSFFSLQTFKHKKLVKYVSLTFYVTIGPRIRCSKILRIHIRIRIQDTPNFAYPYLAYPYFLEHWLRVNITFNYFQFLTEK